MALAANSSNNTVHADADGHIAYFHTSYSSAAACS
jgi:acyl-homoserine lactone acylase PvdQ